MQVLASNDSMLLAAEVHQSTANYGLLVVENTGCRK